jgi:hypothetical protein
MLNSPISGTLTSPTPQLDSIEMTRPEVSARTREARTNSLSPKYSLRVVAMSRAGDACAASDAPNASSTLMMRAARPGAANSSALAAPYCSIVP